MCRLSSLIENFSNWKWSSVRETTPDKGIRLRSPSVVCTTTFPWTLIPQMTPDPPSSVFTFPPSLGRESNPPMIEREEMMADCWAVKFSPSPSASCICRIGISDTISLTRFIFRQMYSLIFLFQAGRRWRVRRSLMHSSAMVDEWLAVRETLVPRPFLTFCKSPWSP